MLFKTLRALQNRCDELSFSIHGKGFQDLTEQELLAHECFHLGKLLGKISAVCESIDHGRSKGVEQIKGEVVPDLIIYALRFANLYDVDLDLLLVERAGFVLDKHHLADSASKASLLAELRAFLRSTDG